MVYSFRTKSFKSLKKRHYIKPADGSIDIQIYRTKGDAINQAGYLHEEEAGQLYFNLTRTKDGFVNDEIDYIPAWAIKEFFTEETHPQYFL